MLSRAWISGVCMLCAACSTESSRGPGAGSGGVGTHLLAMRIRGNGAVHSASPSFSCRADCTQLIAGTLALTATPDAGNTFAGWSGDCAGTGNCTLTMDADHTLSALFAATLPPPPPGTFGVAVNLIGAGTGRVTSSPAGIDCPGVCAITPQSGTSITLTAQSASDSTFAGWGGACHGSGFCTLTTSEQVSAEFEPAATPADECAALQAPPPGPSQGRHAMAANGNSGLCLAGLSDGHGTLALQAAENGDNPRFTLHFVSPAGDLLMAYPHADVELIEQLSGFEGQSLERVDPNSFTDGWMLRTYDTAGRQLAQEPVPLGTTELVIEDPLGGMMLQVDSHPSELRSYDQSLKLRWRVPLPLGDQRGSYGSAVDRAGNALVLFVGNQQTAPNTVDGIWIDHDGQASSIFRVAGPFPTFPQQVSLAARVGSGLFVRVGSDWVGQIDSLATSPMSPAPTWLQARPHTTLHMVRNGAGYAVLPETNDACAQTIEIIATSGKVCGTPAFSPRSSSCRFTRTRVGYDGTVMLGYGSGADQCVWEWWARFLG